MDQVKALLQNKRFVFTVVGIFLGVVIFLLGIFFLIRIIHHKTSYVEIENRLIVASSKYLDTLGDTSHADGEVITFSDQELVNAGLIKNISDLAKEHCSSEIQVTFRNQTSQIRPYLTCDHYESTTIFDQVLLDNPVVTDESGIYDLQDMLIFRGDRVNNYLEFQNTLYRILKMDPDTHTISLLLNSVKSAPYAVWDDKYNTTEESTKGINDFDNSAVYYTLKDMENELFSDYSKMISTHPCIGKRSPSENTNTGEIECSLQGNSSFVTLLPLYDYIHASLDHRCTNADSLACSNQNYLIAKDGKWWTLTADGSVGTKVYGISYKGTIVSDHANTKKYIRYVITIDGDNLYVTGDGTEKNPYQIK